MDANIRQLIILACSADEGSNLKALLQAFKGLQQAFSEAKNSDGTDTCGTDLYVLCAEAAYKLKQEKICQECLQMYFNGVPLTNQFLCRAYLCQAQLLSPKSSDDIVDFETAVVYLLKAINFAKDKNRYHFIVYNASVLYWKLARPFIRPGFRGVLCQSLSQIVKALELIDDKDYDWRAQLMICLVEAYLDEGNHKEAASAALAASQFCTSQATSKFKDVIALQIKHKLVDMNKLSKDINSVPAFKAFSRLQRIKLATSGEKSKVDLANEIHKLLSFITGKSSTPSLPASKPSSRDRKSRLSVDTVVSIDQSDTESLRQSREIRKSLEEERIELEISDPETFSLRPSLLIDITRLCIENDLVNLAKECLRLLKECNIEETAKLIEMEFINCELMVRELEETQEDYSKTSVQVRIAAIKRMDQALQNAVRSGNPNVIQGACVTQWNLCLPLLQRNLRGHVRSPLTRVAQALEDISSLQVNLRCQIHIELAKCEESVEQAEAAVKHLNKALLLDEHGAYRESLQTLLHRLQVSTQLYRTPDRDEDIAAIIIEQARKSPGSGSAQMRRSLLIKAGQTLAPDAFQFVLDSESLLKAKSSLKGNISATQLQAARARLWGKCMKKAPGHLKRLGSENDRERARLWVDLTKTARKQQVWDVCRVAATFCLLYDDGRWRIVTKSVTERRSEDRKSATASSKKGDQSEEQREDGARTNSDLLRMFAEISFIKGEALIQFLNDEGLKLNEPAPPVTSPAGAKQSVRYKDVDQNTDWMEYADWIHEINRQATDAFLRAIELGIELEEQWVVSNGAVYLWNYNQHHVAGARYKQLVPTFEKVLFGLQKIGHVGVAELLSRICDVIAKGLLSPWIPKPLPEGAETIPTAPKESRRKTGGKGTGAAAVAPTSASLQVASEASDDLQKAMTICEYAIQVTNGANLADCVPTCVRHQLLSTWVALKQMLQQQIAPHYGEENEKIPKQQAMTKCLVLLEMLTLNNNKMAPFTVLTIEEVCDLVQDCEWDDAIVELEVWARLTKLAHLQKNHELVQRCGEKALKLEQPAVDAGKKTTETRQLSKTWGMLSAVCGLLGESLMGTCASNPPARRQALHQFVSSANYGKEAATFDVVMSAARRWWNAALPLINSPLERELLRSSLEAILSCISRTFKLARVGESIQEENSEAPDKEKEVKEVDDLSVIAAMYGLLIQTFIDKEEWANGLALADRALHEMPRTHHRLLLFKHRVIMKAKLGANVETDIAKFRDESEDYVANMWHRVALSSRDGFEQLSAFQKAIEALHSNEMKWQKFEYLLQLATWMHSNEFAVADSTNVIEWACDTLLSLNFEEARAESREKEKKKKEKASRGLSSAVMRSTAKSKPQVAIAEPEQAEVYICPVLDGKLRIELTNPDLNIDNLRSARQLEGLIRSHVMMAMVHGAGSEQQRVHCQLAYSFVLRLWKLGLSSAAVALKSMSKLDHGSDGEKKTPGTKTAPTTSEKPKRRGPVDALPASTSEWAHYSITDDIKQAFLFDKGDAAINKHNFTCAGLTVYYLLELSEILREVGMNHLALPVLCLAWAVTEVALQCNSWSQLIILKQVLVCYELHLNKAAKQWENLVREKLLEEDEQVRSRQGLELQDIYKELAKREEERIREAAQAGGTQIETRQKSSTSERESASNLGGLVGRRVGGIYPSEIWTEKARVLLKLGYQQTCRQLLYEALMVSEYENNDTWRADIYHVMAELAIHERNSGQALQLIKRAQAIGGDETFWKENIYLLIDAITLNQNPSTDDYVKVTKIVEYSIGCLNKLLEKRPTKKSAIGYLRASLMAHLCFMHLQSHSSAYTEQLTKLEEVEDELQALGFHRKLASLHLKHSAILLELTRRKSSPRAFFLSSIRLLRRSAANLARLCSDALVVDGDRGVSLPACRELMNVQLHLVEAMLEAASFSLAEDWKRKAEENAKGELQRAVDDYISTDRIFNDAVDEEWERERRGFTHQAITILTSLHTNLPKQHVLRAEWLYLYGRCLHLIGNRNLSSDHQWIPGASPQVKPSAASTMGNTEPGEDSSTTMSVDENKLEENIRANTECERAIRMLSHSSEALAQSVNMALQLSEIEIVSKASQEILQCTAQYDPSLSAAYLLLFQSAEFSKRAKSLLMKTLSDPSDSQFSALIHQEMWLARQTISTGLHECLVRQNILKSLDHFEAWKRIKVTPQHLSFIKDLPSTFNYVVLQASRDEQWLYCAVLRRSKTVVASSEGKGKSKEKFTNITSPPRIFLTRVEFDTQRHASLLEEFSDFQQQWMSFLLQKEYQNHQIATRKIMLEKLAETEENIAGNVLEKHKEEEHRLKYKYLEVLKEIDQFFEPMSAFIDTNLIQSMTSQKANDPPDNPADSDQIIILTSPSLHHYPLEYLSCFQPLQSVSLSREFSLQLLYCRCTEEPTDVTDKKKTDSKSAGKGGKKSGKKSANPATKVTLKEPPSGSRSIDQSSVHYVIDPCNDFSHTESHPPAKVFRNMLELFSNNTARWSGLFGTDAVPSFGQFEKALQQCAMFIYYGTENFIGLFRPSKLASINLSSSQLVLLLDKAHSHKSFYRQSKVNVDKTSLLLGIEKPVETAMLLSICGTNAICLNHLHTNTEENARKLTAFIDGMIQGKTVGHAARMSPLSPAADPGQASPAVAEMTSVDEYEPFTFNLILFGLPNLVFA